MSDKESTKHFFDHSLQTVTPPDVPMSISETAISTNIPSEDHEDFSFFKHFLKSIFSQIPDSTIYQLYEKHCRSETSIQSAINDILDHSDNFSNQEEREMAQFTSIAMKRRDKYFKRKDMMEMKNKEVSKPNHAYVSRKRSHDSTMQDGKSSYFGTNTHISKSAPNSSSLSSKSVVASTEGSRKRSATSDILRSNGLKIQKNENKNYWKRYIGTLNISCWCTRSIYNLNSIYTDNRLVFTRPHNSELVYVSHQSEGSPYRRELGRINEGKAGIISALLDEEAIAFESKLFFVDGERLSTGDSFVVRCDCYLSQHIFENEHINDGTNEELDIEQLKVMKNSNGNVEAGTRLKGSVLKLFDLIGLKSVQDQNKNKTVVDLSYDDDDTEFEELQKNVHLQDDPEDILNDDEDDASTDASKLTMNQVRDLYKSTKSNDLQQNIPQSTPNNFKIELRPYQKQGLSWMLQREKEYDLIGMNNSELNDNDKTLFTEQLKLFENSLNPLWKEYRWPEIPKRLKDTSNLPENFPDVFYLNLYKGTCSLTRPVIKSTCKGGILADEMGLGKTITTLSLVLSFPKDVHYEALDLDDTNITDNYAYGTTLIVVPMALLTQWEKEFAKVAKNQDDFRCFIYYGSDSLGNLKELLCGPNYPTVVLTTYGMIQSEWSRYSRAEVSSKKTGLFSVKFLRVILDEGHTIRNKSTKTAKAICTLQADRRWVLTGTPIINRLEDLFSLVHFLDLRPWSYHSLWKHCISIPFDTGKDVSFAIELLKSILDPILLRRTKNQKDKDGNYLVVLPPKEVVIEKLAFNKREKAIYEWLKEKAVNSFNENFKSGMVFKNYSTILTQLLRLRQVCCHIDLIKTGEDTLEDIDSTGASTDQSKQQKLSTKVDDEMLSLVEMIELNEEQQKLPIEKIKQLKEEIYTLYPSLENVECSICTETVNIDTCVITECKHCFCLDCLTEHFDFQLKHEKGEHITNNTSETDRGSTFLEAEEVFCPMCRKQLNRNRLFRTVKKKNPNVVAIANTDTNDSFLTQHRTSGNGQGREYFVRPFTPNEHSSKINALLIHLERIRNENPGEHIIVFSQFTSFLDIIEAELEKYTGEFEVVKFDGRLNLEQRQHVLSQFEKPITEGEHKVSILLLSLKAGGVGLNLTVASRAFLMDPHWNNATEFQAIDRIHRVGQLKDVKVVRFIMENSIEERMLAIQERKNQLGEALTISDEERRKRKLEELQSLFKE